eukprot:7591909-Pyramimonas_sp.AAC.1
MEIAGAFDEHMRSVGWAPGERFPYGGVRSFMDAWDWGSMSRTSLRRRTHVLRRWHKAFL